MLTMIVILFQSPVCRNFFMVYNCIGQHVLKSILSSLRSDKFSLFEHGRVGRQGLLYSNGVKTRKKVRKFLKRFAHIHGLPMPGGLTSKSVVLLPSDMTVLSIFNVFRESNVGEISYETFRQTWSIASPNIKIMSKATDVCETCFFFRQYALRSKADELQGILDEWELHRNLASSARQFYKDTCIMFKAQWMFLPPNMRQELQDKRGVSMQHSPVEYMVYSFDFAQNVYLPFSSQQPGPVYFKSMFQVFDFGFACEGIGTMKHLLFNERQKVKKGGNCVVSLVHAGLETLGVGENFAVWYCDNCCGQNKNKILMWYALWRVLRGLNESIEIRFMIVGYEITLH